MQEKRYWADTYVENRRDGQAALRLIKPGQRVFIGSGCGEPQHLVRQLAEQSNRLADIEIVRLLTVESAPLTLIANKTADQTFNLRSFYLGTARSKDLKSRKRFITPMNLSAVPRLFRSHMVPIHVALIQVSPPDDFGWMSLGISVDITMAATQAADLVIAQVNAKMPRVLGQSFVHVNDIDIFVEFEEDLLTIAEVPDRDSARRIADFISLLIEDGATLQISPGTTPQATLSALAGRKDLGIHTEYMTDGIMRLVAAGVVTNRKKGINEGKLVASSAIGSPDLYTFLDDNPSVEFHPSDYVNNPDIISRHNKMVSLNVAMAMDLTGQVAADALAYNHFCGVTGMLDFMRGAARAPGGKVILMLPSTTPDGKQSRIVPNLADTVVVVPRGDVYYVVTEYGAINLFGKSLEERAIAMISIAHPDFRDELFKEAKASGLLGEGRSLKEALHGVYPVHLEETITRKNQTITIRPAKPVDRRRIQEHLYTLEKKDVVARFFHEKRIFKQAEAEGVSTIDYIHDLTLLAVVGEFGFRKVIAIGEYLREPARNIAEVAFSVSREFQGMGLGTVLLRKLAAAARENGIGGLVAYTSPRNKGMIKLFQTLPYPIHSQLEDDLIELRCEFEETPGGGRTGNQPRPA